MTLVCFDPDSGVHLDLRHAALGDSFLAEAEARWPAIRQEMVELEGGALANPSEGRQVGHYWLRSSGHAPADRAPAIEAAHATRARIVAAAAEHDFRAVALVGIGGSALGPQLLADALRPLPDAIRRAPVFFDNTDPDGIALGLQQLAEGPGLAHTLVLVISKSGGTRETRNAWFALERAWAAAGLDFGAHAVAITVEGSRLWQAAEGWFDRASIWSWVGGRTSVTSAVGLLPCALWGRDAEGLLAGAAAMDRWTRTPELRANPAALLAFAWHALGDGRGDRAMVVLPYKDRLLLLSRYLQQLVMESLGKARTRQGVPCAQGIAVYGNKGSTDQHAFVQQLRDGRDDFFVTFLRVLEDTADGLDPEGLVNREFEARATAGEWLQGFWLGTRAALAENNRPSLTLTLPRLDAHHLGMAIALFERAVGFYASLVDINAYDQPGVEAGKKAADRALALGARIRDALAAAGGAALSLEELAQQTGGPLPMVEAICEHLAFNRDEIESLGDGPPHNRSYRTHAG